MLLALIATPALAQPAGHPQPKAQPPGTQQPGGLPLPPGYRPRTPPPQQQAQPQRSASTAMPGSAGTVMYFQKPADALTATGGGLSANTGVAQLNDPGRVPALPPIPVPDAPPVPVRPVLPPPAITIPQEIPTGYAAQPVAQPPVQPRQPGGTTSTSQKKKQEFELKPVDPKAIGLPAREKIFGFVYNDAELEKAIMTVIIQDRIKLLEDRVSDLAKQKMDTKELEKNIQDLKAIKDPSQYREYQFPPLPVISPPDVPYQPKTVTYAPRKLYIEPSYVVHRRLHFEERNSERAGWDLGPLSTLVTAGHFYRDVLLWPQSLVSGCVHGPWDTSAGKCLPGSPTPYYLYPPGLTLTGTLAEAGIITGGAFLFP